MSLDILEIRSFVPESSSVSDNRHTPKVFPNPIKQQSRVGEIKQDIRVNGIRGKLGLDEEVFGGGRGDCDEET